MKKTVFPKLPLDFKKKWLKGLRSGNFKQSTNSLRSENNEFCCLGVAGKIVGVTCMTGKGVFKSDEKVRGITKVPQILRGDSTENKLVAKLIRLNNRFKFAGVADWIEKNL